jgi:hypothetical protein
VQKAQGLDWQSESFSERFDSFPKAIVANLNHLIANILPGAGGLEKGVLSKEAAGQSW